MQTPEQDPSATALSISGYTAQLLCQRMRFHTLEKTSGHQLAAASWPTHQPLMLVHNNSKAWSLHHMTPAIDQLLAFTSTERCAQHGRDIKPLFEYTFIWLRNILVQTACSH